MSNQTQQTQQTQQQQVALSEIEIKDENIALNVMVAMLNMAQRRGAFSMEESSKAWECVRKFQRPAPPSDNNEALETIPETSEENTVMSSV
jgi:hypothetical protein